MFQFVLNERALFDKVQGDANTVEQKISDAIGKHLSQQTDPASDKDIDQVYRDFYPETWKMKAEAYKISVLEKSKDDPNRTEYIKRKIAYLESYGTDSWQELNSIAWTIYENSEDQDHLRFGQKFALQSIELEENFYNTDTYVWISNKLKDHKAIKLYGPIAIKLGEEDGADVSEIQALLQDLN